MNTSNLVHGCNEEVVVVTLPCSLDMERMVLNVCMIDSLELKIMRQTFGVSLPMPK